MAYGTIQAKPGTGGDPALAFDVIGGTTYYPRGKIAWGPQGTVNEVDVGTPLPVNDPSFNTFQLTGTTVTTVAQLMSTPLTGRKRLFIQNFGPDPIFIGFANTVLNGSGAIANRGIKVSQNGSFERKFGTSVTIWAISDGTSEVVCEESAL